MTATSHTVTDNDDVTVVTVDYDAIDYADCVSDDPEKRARFQKAVFRDFTERGWAVIEKTPLNEMFPVINDCAVRAHNLSGDVKKALKPELLNQHGFQNVGADKMGWRDVFGFLREQPAGVPPNVHAFRQPDDVDFDAYLPGVTAVMDEAAEKTEEIAANVLRAISVGLGEDQSFFDACMEYSFIDIRLNRYPPVEPKERILKHPDFGLVSVVLSEEPGLQVKIDDDHYGAVTPGAGGIVIFAAKALEIATAGLIKTLHHRVYVADPAAARRSVNIFIGGGDFAPMPFFGDKSSNPYLRECPHYDGMTPLLIAIAEWERFSKHNIDSIVEFDQEIRKRIEGRMAVGG